MIEVIISAFLGYFIIGLIGLLVLIKSYRADRVVCPACGSSEVDNRSGVTRCTSCGKIVLKNM